MEFAAFPGNEPPAQEEVNSIVKAALDSGINFFDCAECYGKDHAAHKAFGAALKELGVERSSVVIASKFGRHAALWETESPSGAQIVYTGEMVASAIASSLEALGVEYIDLMQVHWPGNVGVLGGAAYMAEHPEMRENVIGVVKALERAVELGQVRHVGVCNFGCDDLDEWAAAGGTAVSNQLPYNCLWRAVEHAILPRCRADGVAVLCYSALQQGLLSGRAVRASDVPLGKRRTRLYGPETWDEEKCRHGDAALGAAAEAELFREDTGVLERLRRICAGAERSVAEATLAWLLSRDGVACVLAGASNPAQAERNARLTEVPAESLTAVTEATEDLKRILGVCVDQYAKESRIH